MFTPSDARLPSVREALLDLLLVHRLEVARAAEVHLLLLGLPERREVPDARAAELHLAALLHVEALLRAALGLQLGHVVFFRVGGRETRPRFIRSGAAFQPAPRAALRT